MTKKLYLPFLMAMVVALMTSCSKKMGELSSDYFTVTPQVLEAVGGKVPATINGKFPEKYFNKKAVVEVTPVLKWNGGEAKGQSAVFQGEKVDYYGINALSNNLIMVDRKLLKNPNGLILGTPGSGKSFSAKREIANCFLLTSDEVEILDPEAEYAPLVERLHGQVIKISPTSTNYINPMDLNLDYSDDESPLSLKSDFILSPVSYTHLPTRWTCWWESAAAVDFGWRSISRARTPKSTATAWSMVLPAGEPMRTSPLMWTRFSRTM